MIAPSSSFMSQENWLFPSWKVRHSKASHPLQTLLDEAYRFLPVFEKFNILYLDGQSSSFEGHTEELLKLYSTGLSIKSNIDTWFQELQTRFERASHQNKTMIGPQIYRTAFSQWNNDSADPAEHDLGKAFPVTYQFANFSIATSYVFYEAIQICITEFLAEMEHKLTGASKASNRQGSLFNSCCGHSAQSADKLDLGTDDCQAEISQRASHICQSAEYFLHHDKRAIGPMIYLFPLAISTRTFSNLGCGNSPSELTTRKLKWCQMIEARVRATGFPHYQAG
jgi:hypothetical protein